MIEESGHVSNVNIKRAPRPRANGRGGRRGRQFGGCQTVALISIMLLGLRGESENTLSFHEEKKP